MVADLLLIFLIEFHLAYPAFAAKLQALLFPLSPFCIFLLLAVQRIMHGGLIIQLDIDIQQSIEVFLIDCIASCLIFRIGRLAVLFRKSFALAFDFRPLTDDILCILCPDRIIKGLFIQLRRLHRKEFRKIF